MFDCNWQKEKVKKDQKERERGGLGLAYSCKGISTPYGLFNI